jgi:hypothetical protein
MNRSLALLPVGLVLGGLAGFLLAAAYGITLDGHDHATGHGAAAQGGHAMAHDELLSLPDGRDAPMLAISVTADPVSGWNLHIETANFRFAPEHAGQAHVPGEGHAHVYVNDAKIARQYGPWLHIAELPPGRNVIAVTLNANDHRALAGKALRAQTTVVVR